MAEPNGLCGCGCGQPTRIAPYSNVNRGMVRGQPMRFVHGHAVVARAGAPAVGTALPGTKWCGGCQQWIPLGGFYRKAKARDGRQTWCVACRRRLAKIWQTENKDRVREYQQNPRAKQVSREWHLKKTYGLSWDAFTALESEQGGVCAICGKAPAPGKRLVVDHDHITGALRGLLCHLCNFGIGYLQEDTAALLNAIAYLERYSDVRP